MSIQNWRLATIIFAIVCLLIVLLLLLMKPLKNKYNYSCREDHLIKSERKKGARYNVYSVLGRSAFYIDKYIIKSVGKNKVLICDYVKNYDFISYYLLLFNKKNTLMKIMEVNEYNTSFCSKPIKLPKRCTKLNIVSKQINDQEQNINLVGVVSKPSVIIFSVLESIALLCFLFVLRQLLIEAICFDTKSIFVSTNYNIYSIVVIVLISLINYLIISSRLLKTYHHRKVKTKLKGGR